MYSDTCATGVPCSNTETERSVWSEKIYCDVMSHPVCFAGALLSYSSGHSLYFTTYRLASDSTVETDQKLHGSYIVIHSKQEQGFKQILSIVFTVSDQYQAGRVMFRLKKVISSHTLMPFSTISSRKLLSPSQEIKLF